MKKFLIQSKDTLIPLKFKTIPCKRQVVKDCDYSLQGFESKFMIRAVHLEELVHRIATHRGRFKHRLSKMYWAETKNLIIIGDRSGAAQVEDVLSAISDRMKIGIFFVRDEVEAAGLIEKWAIDYLAQKQAQEAPGTLPEGQEVLPLYEPPATLTTQFWKGAAVSCFSMLSSR